MRISFVQCLIDSKLCWDILQHLRMISTKFGDFWNILGDPNGPKNPGRLTTLTASVNLDWVILACKYLLRSNCKWLKILWKFSLIYEDQLHQVLWIVKPYKCIKQALQYVGRALTWLHPFNLVWCTLARAYLLHPNSDWLEILWGCSLICEGHMHKVWWFFKSFKWIKQPL